MAKKAKKSKLGFLRSKKFAALAAVIVAGLAIFGINTFAAVNNGKVGRIYDWKNNKVINEYRTIASRNESSWQFIKYKSAKTGPKSWSYLGAWTQKPANGLLALGALYASRELKVGDTGDDVRVLNSALSTIGKRTNCVKESCASLELKHSAYKRYAETINKAENENKFMAETSDALKLLKNYFGMKNVVADNKLSTDEQKAILMFATTPAFPEKDAKGVVYNWKNNILLFNGGINSKKLGGGWEYNYFKGSVPLGIWTKKGDHKFGDGVLKPGAIGEDVAAMQSMLNWVSAATGEKFTSGKDQYLAVNGMFDKTTEDAVKKFQNKYASVDYGGGASGSTYYTLTSFLSSGIRIPSSIVSKLPKYKKQTSKCGFTFNSASKTFSKKECPKPKTWWGGWSGGGSSGGGTGGGGGGGGGGGCSLGTDCNGNGVIGDSSDERAVRTVPDPHDIFGIPD